MAFGPVEVTFGVMILTSSVSQTPSTHPIPYASVTSAISPPIMTEIVAGSQISGAAATLISTRVPPCMDPLLGKIEEMEGERIL